MIWPGGLFVLEWERLITSLMELLQACRASRVLHTRLRFTEEIILVVGPALREFIARHTRPDLVEDVWQETLIAIAIGIAKCNADTEAAFWTWCYTIARRRMADQWRQIGRLPTISLDPELFEQAIESSRRDEGLTLAERENLEYGLDLLRAAKPPCVNYLWDRFALDLSFKDLGDIYGLSEDAMRMQVNRCLELAQKLMAQELKAKKTKVPHA